MIESESKSQASPPMAGGSQYELPEAVQRALAIYRGRLAAMLEPSHQGEALAIHPDSGQFMLGRSCDAVHLALRREQPEGIIVTMLVGLGGGEPALDRLLSPAAH